MNESDLQQRMHLFTTLGNNQSLFHVEKHLDPKHDNMNLSDKMFVNKIKKWRCLKEFEMARL